MPVTPGEAQVAIQIDPAGLQAPDRLLVPAFTPLRYGQRNRPRYYVPQPQPEGTARVVLGDDYYAGAIWHGYRDGENVMPPDVFDIPAEQRDCWQQAQEAYEAMQEEIRALLER